MEEHSIAALESNRAIRKIFKCGYLFVAPGWDFSNPLNRTKRWQRRWFVLYNDGELTYSVDEHPETVPQARIDMARVLDVTTAEDVTGHPNSLAITSQEHVTFIKGTCLEETRWWADILQVFIRNKIRHKRNTTFPGGQAKLIQIKPMVRSNTPNPLKSRYQNCKSESRTPNSPWMLETTNKLCSPTFSIVNNSNVLTKKNSLKFPIVNPGKGVGNNLQLYLTSSSSATPKSTSNITHPNQSAVMSNVSKSIIPLTTTVKTINAAEIMNETLQKSCLGKSNVTINSEKPSISKKLNTIVSDKSFKDQLTKNILSSSKYKLRIEDKSHRKIMNQHQQQQRPQKSQDTNIATSINEKLNDDACSGTCLKREKETVDKLLYIMNTLTLPKVSNSAKNVEATTIAHEEKLIRGDPDGCGLDIYDIRYTPTSELRIDLPIQNLINAKKGWLMKQNLNMEWNKHWFVLLGCKLVYYQDPGAEEKGIMDGFINLNTVTAVNSIQVTRNYGFQAITWNKQHSMILSAVTAGIRSSWISAIRRAANLPILENNYKPYSLCKIRKQDVNNQSSVVVAIEREKEGAITSESITSRSILFSSDEEHRTASEGGRRESDDWSRILVSPPITQNCKRIMSAKLSTWPEFKKQEWSELPPSPPLTRTALSKVKRRSHSGSRSRVYKRNAPPNSHHRTFDSVKAEDLLIACYKLSETEQSNSYKSVNACLSKINDNPLVIDLLENKVTMLKDQIISNGTSLKFLLVIVQRQENEIEDLKLQLNTVRKELLHAENKICKLRQHKTETLFREKQINELLRAIQTVEQQKKKYMDDLDKMKKLYNHDKKLIECKFFENEKILQETTQRCQILTNELSSSHVTQEQLQIEATALSDRLAQGIEENERLYIRVRELEGKNCFSSSRERGRSFDSLSDLTHIDLDINLNALDKERLMDEYEELRSRFEKAILEIRAMRKELREAHALQDAFELQTFVYRQEANRSNESNQAQIHLMAARIQDLTNKLTTNEKHMRTLKQKLSRVETRDKRKSLSLKERESLQIANEVEDKLLNFEQKIRTIEKTKSTVKLRNYSKKFNYNITKELRRKNKNLDINILRKKSLDSVTYSQPMKVFIKLSTLKSKIFNITESIFGEIEKIFNKCNEISLFNTNSRLRKLERAVAKSKKQLEKYLRSRQVDDHAEKCSQTINEIINFCTEYKQIQNKSRITNSINEVVFKLEYVFRKIICEVMKKHRKLTQIDKLNDKEKIKLIAEKVAFEFIILKKIQDVIQETDRNTVLNGLIETSQLILNLKFKVNKTKSKIYQNTIYIQYLTKILVNKLVSKDNLPKIIENSIEISSVQIKDLHFLFQKHKEINGIFITYTTEKLRFLVEALVIETFCLYKQEKFEQINLIDNKFVEDKISQDTQKIISKELIQVKVTYLMCCSQIFEQNISFTQNIDLILCIDKVKNILKQEIENTIHELTIAYKECIKQLKKKNIYLYQQFSKAYENKILNKLQSQEQIKNIAQTLIDITNDIDKLKQRLKKRISKEIDNFNWPKLSIIITDWVSIYNKCSEIRKQIKLITNCVENMMCKRCEQLEHKIQWLNSKHSIELQKLRSVQKKDLMHIKNKWDNHRNSLTVQYEQEITKLRERIRKLEYKLNTIDSEQSVSVNKVQAAYQRSVNIDLDTDIETRKRYKEEIKQLRALCEKGLLAMENSHRRVISELEEKHRHELENLRTEKEQALSEETQATLAALDAMRKAHEHEVQKEIAKFKQKFIKQVQAREDIGILHKEHEQEMKEIKQEILSLSAKYSLKCVKSAVLEEKVDTLTKQLAQAQEYILKLDARNKQLCKHLIRKTNDNSFNTVQFLKNRDNEITEEEEIYQTEVKSQ
ncbi:PREDICTED: protein outspread [Ceratosolen solmsi marchali]|uniref:Protein outspread n=1 Tax=Ceratosolen solmsi marchali TaxID=326594 RepID=A0AAJ7DZX8_9HYME|nr:PREDICTED: protein outspread [Ceratosolen solmsi marchali]